jgi:hypothetical protein
MENWNLLDFFLFSQTFVFQKWEQLKLAYLCEYCVLLCSSKEIPEELKNCCNYKGEFFYPSKEKIMQYAVVVVTVISAARYALLFFFFNF